MEMVKINTPSTLAWLSSVMENALKNGHDVHLCVDGGLKVKVGGSMWTAPLGTSYTRG